MIRKGYRVTGYRKRKKIEILTNKVKNEKVKVRE